MVPSEKYMRKLYGREKETERIEALFKKACTGEPCLLFLNGPSGSGKTALMKHVENLQVFSKGIYVKCKFDQFNPHKPYYPFLAALKELIRYLLARPKKEIEIKKERLSHSIGINYEALYGILPELELLFGKKTHSTNITLQSRNSLLQRALLQIARVLLDENKPLILFIDDLHWADESSLSLLEYICCNIKDAKILIICAFRENNTLDNFIKRIESIDQKNFNFENIPIENLSLQHTYDLVSDLFEDSKDLDMIVNKLFQATLGNPFLINQVIKEYEASDIIDLDYKHLEISSDVIQSVAKKIAGLSEDTQKALAYAAIVGVRLSLRKLSVVSDCFVEDFFSLLKPAIEKGIIVLDESKYEFEFTHDKFREYIISRIENPKQMHLDVGRRLLNYYENDVGTDALIGILHHFIISADLIKNRKEKLELARYFSVAGKSLIRCYSYHTAIKYLEVGVRFIESEEKSDNYILKYNTYSDYAYALYLTGNIEHAEEIFELVLSLSKSIIDYLRILQRKISLYYSCGKYKDAITTGLTALTKLGLIIPYHPSKLEIAKNVAGLIWLYRDKNIHRILKRKENNSAELEIILNILMTIIFPAYLINIDLCFVFLMNIVKLSIKNGNTKYASVGYTVYGVLIGSMLGLYSKEKKLRDISIELLKDIRWKDYSYLTDFISAGFVNYWLYDWHENIFCFDRAYAGALEHGEYVFAACAINMKIDYLFRTGMNLNELMTEIEKVQKKVDELNVENMSDYLVFLAKAYEAVKLLKTDALDDSIYIQQFQNTDIMVYNLLKMQYCFLAEKCDDAAGLVLASQKHEKVFFAHYQYADYLFYQSLIITGCTGSLEGKYEKILRKNLCKLKKWYKSCPNNFGHKFYLISAEIARIKGKSDEAADQYNKAVTSAAENGFTQNEAIASELAGKFYFSVGYWKEAEANIINACKKYEQWGSDAKVELLKKTYPFLQKEPSTTNIVVPTPETDSLNNKLISSFMLFSQEENPEKLIDRILSAVLDIGDGERVFVLIEKNDDLVVFLLRNSGQAVTYINVPLLEYNGLPKMPIYYTYNTYQTAYIKPNENGVMDNDPYLNKRHQISGICIPLRQCDIFYGILYLEKNATSKECSSECIKAINTLASQAFLAVKAHLFTDEVENKENERIAFVKDLTIKEIEVLRLISAGNSNKEIADILGVTVNTVKTHVLSIYNKLNVNKRTQAALIAKEQNIL